MKTAPPDAPPRLTAAEITVKDVLGIRRVAIQPGRVTRIEGRNGSMKSSLAQAIQVALGGGSLAKFARIGEAGEEVEPEVAIVFDGDAPAQVRVVKKGDKTAEVTQRVGETQAFEKVAQPQTWLSRRFDAKGCNIVQLLRAPDKDIATLLLESLPLELDRAELRTVLGDHAKHVRPLPKGLHPLEELAMTREDVFKARTAVNVQKDSAKKTADQLRRALPAVMPETREAEIRTAEQRRDALAAEIAQEEERGLSAEREALATARRERDAAGEKVLGEFRGFAAKKREELATEVRKVETELERRIADLRKEAQLQIDAMKAATEAAIEAKRTEGEKTIDGAEAALATAQETARAAREATQAALQKKREELTALRERLASLETERDQALEAKGVAEQAEKFEGQEAELRAESERLTATLAALDAFRLRLAKALPVPGLEIAGPEVRVDGVPWPQLNKGQRVAILVKVAVLRAQGYPIPLIFVDDAETLDSEHLALLEKELEASGVQALICRVSDTDLQAVADGAPAAVATE